MRKIIKQIEQHEVYNVVTRIHDQEDVQNGDLVERLENYEYFNHIQGYSIASLSLDEFHVDQDKVDDIIYEIKESGLSTMPKIVIDEEGSFIDGIHRTVALQQLGYSQIDLLKGTNEKFNPKFKKELIDESLQIYKISNDFGSISIMENAKYSPADNSVFEFLVDDKYQGLGVGTELLKEAMKQYGNLGAQVSSIASLKVFLECGLEPHDINNRKAELDFTSYDFKTFNKCPELLGEQAAMYRQSIEVFQNKFNQAKDLFNNNGGSLFCNDIRPNNKNTSKNRPSI